MKKEGQDQTFGAEEHLLQTIIKHIDARLEDNGPTLAEQYAELKRLRNEVVRAEAKLDHLN